MIVWLECLIHMGNMDCCVMSCHDTLVLFSSCVSRENVLFGESGDWLQSVANTSPQCAEDSPQARLGTSSNYIVSCHDV